MVIDRIGNINKISGTDNVQKKNLRGMDKNGEADSVSISKEAQAAQELAKATRTVKEAPDIRQDRVNAVREKLARGEYDNIGAEIIEKVAEKIADSLIR